MSEEKTKVEINVVQVVASALAAVSSAVLLSTVGVAGTLIGAAAGSVIATVGAAIYSYSLRVSRERVAAAQAAAMARVHRIRSGQGTVTIADVAEPAADERPAWREALTRVRWKWIALVAAAVFVIAMLVIVGFEVVSGRSVSTLTGGSSGSGHRTSLGFGSSGSKTGPSPTPSPSASTSSTPSSSVGSTASPSASPTAPATSTPTPTPAPTASDTAGSTPSSEPTDVPTGTPSPSIVP